MALTFAFDLGKASIGYCVRTADTLLDLGALEIPAEHATVADFRTRRRMARTRLAHQAREKWLNQLWLSVGLPNYSQPENRRNLPEIGKLGEKRDFLTIEFSGLNNDTLVNSVALRVALLQGKPLEPWQIYKALRSAIQRRGYDANNHWEAHEDEDDKTAKSDKEINAKSVTTYQNELVEKISDPQYHLPCYLEAYLMGLWTPDTPEQIHNTQPSGEKVRRSADVAGKTPGRIAPRDWVEREVKALFIAAQKLLPVLNTIDVDYFIYGEGRKAYASLNLREFKRFRGTQKDWEGVLSQKVPRFDNRIMGKCQLFPERNTCKASVIENRTFVLLLKLKNARFTGDGVSLGESRALTPSELKKAFDHLKEKDEITPAALMKVLKLKEVAGVTLTPVGMRKEDKWKIKQGGRSRFCRPALQLMNDIILNGWNPPDVDLTPYLQAGENNPIRRPELEKALSRLGESWETFHVGDRRDELFQMSAVERQAEVQTLIGQVNNPVVRNRMQYYHKLLQDLAAKHGQPNRVIVEFVRGEGGLEGQKRAAKFEQMIKANEKYNDQLRKDLTSLSLSSRGNDYLTRLKLLREQGGHCPYTGNPLDETQIGYNYQVDHIVPVSAAISCDALYNKVLCETDANSAKKGQTPYEWLHQDAAKWEEFTARVKTMPGLSKKKLQLLTSANAPELVESWNGLAETAHLARLSQHVTTLQYGWPMQVQGENRRFFVNNGSMTSRMARLYKLYNVLHDPETLADPEKRQEANKKLRSNKKHHAIDAFIISFSQEIKVEQTPGYDSPHWFIPTIKPFLNQFHEQIANVIPMRRCRDFKKDRYPEDTIYGYRERVHPENSSKKQYCMVVHKALISILEKKPEKDTGWLKIWDEAIRADLKQKAETLTDKQAWIQLLKTYQHPTRHCPVKRILWVVSESDTPLSIEERPALGEFRDYGKDQTRGQFKKTTQHRGQLVYQDEKGRYKVQPVYGSSSLKAVKKQLEARGVRLYKNGMLFSAGVMVHVSQPFTGDKGRQCESGFYQLKTLKSKGDVKLENANGKEIMTSIKHLVDADISVIPYTGGKRKIPAEAEPLTTS